ncbi:MAG: transposase, partial [Acidobacteriota bacterium]
MRNPPPRLCPHRCGHCRKEYLLAFSRKTRYFCPSFQAKRVAAFVEWLNEQVLEAVGHRQLVWTIPRVLRPTFRRDRRLLGEPARCAWKTLEVYTRGQSLDRAAAGGAIVAIQTYGDPLNFHPHLHSLVSNGVWDRQEQFQPFGPLDPQPPGAHCRADSPFPPRQTHSHKKQIPIGSTGQASSWPEKAEAIGNSHMYPTPTVCRISSGSASSANQGEVTRTNRRA